jgi:ribosomal protein S6--L-glutamate ligase
MTTDIIKLGWEEWLSLPDLDLPAIKAKIDTGARTSALHATAIEPFGPERAPKVRFTVHPIPGNPDLAIQCSARLHDRREVTSSNGEAELRCVIKTTLQFADSAWPIEVTLTDREGMAYHMLLGRMALVERCLVVPGESHQQPELSYDAYNYKPAKKGKPRPLRIALLTSQPNTRACRMVMEEGELRGHGIEPLDPSKLQIVTSDTAPRITQDGHSLPRYDAVIPRMATTRYNTALLRQFAALGSYSPNSADGMAAAHDPVRAQQILMRTHIPVAERHFPVSDKASLPDDAIEVLITGRKLKVLTRHEGRALKLTREERRTALRAARAFKLSWAGMTLRRADDGLQVLDISSRPDITRALMKTGKNPLETLFALLEKHARPKPPKTA